MAKHKSYELVNIRLWKETGLNEIDHYYLYLEYLVRIGDEVYKHIYPKVDLEIASDDLPIEENRMENDLMLGFSTDNELIFKSGQHYRALTTNFEYYTRYGEKENIENAYRVTEHLTMDLKKPKKMTKEEIEKALGYEIELVGQ